MSDHTISIIVDGHAAPVLPGQSIAAALLAAGIATFRRTEGGAPRGPYCGMGVCYECVVTVDGQPGVRACTTLVAEGMLVETGAASAL